MEGRFTYQDLDLLIEPGQEGSYRTRVLRSPAGESAAVQFTLPFSAVEVENFVLKVGQPRRRTRGHGRPESAPLKTFGGKLYDAVFHHEVRDILERSLTLTRAQGTGMRLRLRLRDTPELAELPWEFLYDPRRNRFLAQSSHTPLVRYLDLPDPPHPLAVDGPLRLLVMISNPSGYPALDVEQEWRLLSEALAQEQADGRVIVERLVANMSILQDRLSHGGFHVFHFVGHGYYRPDWDDGVLVMEDRAGRPQEVTGEDLGVLLTDYGLTRLAVLNACEGARSGASDPFAGTAQSLIQQGLPAVVAMQFEITDDAAIIFAHELYTAIAYGYPLEAALAQARRAILYEGNPTEWGTPVLYSRAPDGRLFDLPRPPLTPDTHRSAAEEEEADRRAQEEADRRAQEEADRRAQELATRYTEANAAAKAGDWDQALAVFTTVAELDPGYRDTRERVEDARKQQQIATLQAEVRRLHQAGQWAAVAEVGQRLHALDPAAADVGGLVTAARSQLAEAKRTEQLESGYQTALRQADAGNLREAIDTLERVVGLAPSDHPARALLDQTRRQLADSSRQQRDERPQDSGPPAGGPQPLTCQAGQLVSTVAFSPDGTLLAAGIPGAVHLWNPQAAASVRRLPMERQDTVRALAFSPDGTRLAASIGQAARVWDVTTGQQQLEVTHSGNSVLAVVFSQDGTRLATGDGRPYARIWDATTGHLQMEVIPGLAARPPSSAENRRSSGVMAASPTAPVNPSFGVEDRGSSGSMAASPSAPVTPSFGVEDRGSSGSMAASLSGAVRGKVHAVAFSPDGTRLAIGARKAIHIANLQTAAIVGRLPIGRHDTVRALAFSPDGTRLAASIGRAARVWDVTTGQQQLEVTHSGNMVLAVAFNSNGTRIATGGDYLYARVWDATTGDLQLRVAHDRSVLALAFSPDGTQLATGSEDKTLRIWDLTGG